MGLGLRASGVMECLGVLGFWVFGVFGGFGVFVGYG